MAKAKRPGYIRTTWRDERGKDRTCELTAILAFELVSFGIADLKRNSTRELRIRNDYVLTKRDGKWTPATRTSSLPAQESRPLDWRLKVRTNAEMMLRRALYNYSAEDALDFRWILALNA